MACCSRHRAPRCAGREKGDDPSLRSDIQRNARRSAHNGRACRRVDDRDRATRAFGRPMGDRRGVRLSLGRRGPRFRDTVSRAMLVHLPSWADRTHVAAESAWVKAPDHSARHRSTTAPLAVTHQQAHHSLPLMGYLPITNGHVVYPVRGSTHEVIIRPRKEQLAVSRRRDPWVTPHVLLWVNCNFAAIHFISL
jgi:hypothetical protein